MKTPEQLAEEYAFKFYLNEDSGYAMTMNRDAFLAGYQAAKDTYKDAISTYEEVAKQMMEEAVRIMSPKNEVADANKVMSQWISVKDRLPEDGEQVFVIYSGKHCKDVHLSYYENGWSSLVDVTHWMPLPEAPKDE